MVLSRRQFVQSLGAAALTYPFLQSLARAATSAPQKRLVIMWSLGTVYDQWKPTSAPGQPLVLSTALAPLGSIKDSIMLVDGLTMVRNPSEGHSTPQTFTGFSNSDMGRGQIISVDQFIAQQVNTSTLPTFLLGADAKNEGQFFKKDARIPPMDSPSIAYQTAFGATGGTTQSGVTMPRTAILDLVSSQLNELKNRVGTQAGQRLEDHLTSVAQLQKSITTGGAISGKAPAPPNLNGADPEAQANNSTMGELNMGLIVSALAAGVTQIAGMQWGVSNTEFISDSTVNSDEHSAVHSGSVGTNTIIASETFFANQFVNLVNKLKTTPDPSGQGMLYDNTLVIWARDIGNGPVHMQFNMPYVLASGSTYLKTASTGTYMNFGGTDNDGQGAGVTGLPHEQLLYNLCDFMGVTNFTGFGSLTGSQKTFLTQIKR